MARNVEEDDFLSRLDDDLPDFGPDDGTNSMAYDDDDNRAFIMDPSQPSTPHPDDPDDAAFQTTAQDHADGLQGAGNRDVEHVDHVPGTEPAGSGSPGPDLDHLNHEEEDFPSIPEIFPVAHMASPMSRGHEQQGPPSPAVHSPGVSTAPASPASHPPGQDDGQGAPFAAQAPAQDENSGFALELDEQYHDQAQALAQYENSGFALGPDEQYHDQAQALAQYENSGFALGPDEQYHDQAQAPAQYENSGFALGPDEQYHDQAQAPAQDENFGGFAPGPIEQYHAQAPAQGENSHYPAQAPAQDEDLGFDLASDPQFHAPALAQGGNPQYPAQAPAQDEDLEFDLASDPQFHAHALAQGEDPSYSAQTLGQGEDLRYPAQAPAPPAQAPSQPADVLSLVTMIRDAQAASSLTNEFWDTLSSAEDAFRFYDANKVVEMLRVLQTKLTLTEGRTRLEPSQRTSRSHVVNLAKIQHVLHSILDSMRRNIEDFMRRNTLDFMRRNTLDFMQSNTENEIPVQDLAVPDRVWDFVVRLTFASNTSKNTEKLVALLDRNDQVRELGTTIPKPGPNNYEITKLVVARLEDLEAEASSPPLGVYQESMLATWLSYKDVFEVDATVSGFRGIGNQFGQSRMALGLHTWSEASSQKHADAFLQFVKSRPGTWPACVTAQILVRAQADVRVAILQQFTRWCAAVLFCDPASKHTIHRSQLRVKLDKIFKFKNPEGDKPNNKRNRSFDKGGDSTNRPSKTQRSATEGFPASIYSLVQAVLGPLVLPLIARFKSAYARALPDNKPSSHRGLPSPSMQARQTLYGVSPDFLALFARFAGQRAPNDALDTDKSAFEFEFSLVARLTKPARAQDPVKSLVDFLRSDEGASLKGELLSLAATPKEQDARQWFGRATDYVCSPSQMPFSDIVDALGSAAAPQTYWWMDLFSLPHAGDNPDAIVNEDPLLKPAHHVDSVVILVDSWEKPAVQSRSCRAAISDALDFDKRLRLALPSREQAKLDDFSKAWIRTAGAFEATDAPSAAGATSDTESSPTSRVDQSLDTMGDSLRAAPKVLDDSNEKRSKQVDLKVRFALLSVVLEPAKAIIRKHEGIANVATIIRSLKGHFDVIDVASASLALAPSFVIRGDTSGGIKLLAEVMTDVSAAANEANSSGETKRAADLENALGKLVFSMGRFFCDSFSGDEAVACAEICCDKAIEVLRACDDPFLSKAQYVLARTLVNAHMSITTKSRRDKAKDIAKAEAALDEAIKAMEEASVSRADLGALYVHRAKLLDLKGEPHAQVQEAFDMAMSLQSKLYGPSDPRVILTTKCLGQSWYWRENYEQALLHWCLAFPTLCSKAGKRYVSAFHVYKILEFTSMGFGKLCEQRRDLRFQESDFVCHRVEPAFAELREAVFADLQGNYPQEACRWDDIGFNWIASVLRRVLILDTDRERAERVGKSLLSDNIDILSDATQASDLLGKHVYACVILASDLPSDSISSFQEECAQLAGAGRACTRILRLSPPEADPDAKDGTDGTQGPQMVATSERVTEDDLPSRFRELVDAYAARLADVLEPREAPLIESPRERLKRQVQRLLESGDDGDDADDDAMSKGAE